MRKMQMELPPLVARIIRELHAAGHRAVVVGGAVRDALLGLPPKDIDVEVYGMAYDRLAEFVSRFGRVDLVGKSFGVVKLHDVDDLLRLRGAAARQQIRPASPGLPRGF